MNENVTASKARGSALIPFLVFIIVYLGAGIILDRLGVDMAFYQFPSPVAALIGIVVAFIMFKGSIDESLLFSLRDAVMKISLQCALSIYSPVHLPRLQKQWAASTQQ